MPEFCSIPLTNPIRVLSESKKIKSPIAIQCNEKCVRLETNRLVFRSLNYFNRDVLRENYTELLTNPENLTHYGTGEVWTPEEINDFLTHEIQQKEDGRLYGAFSVHEKETGRFIGSMSVNFHATEYAKIGVGHENVAEISYILIQSAWGVGYGKELASVGKKFSSFILESKRDSAPSEVVATVHPANRGSERILEGVLKKKEEEEFKKFGGNSRFLFFKLLTEGKTHFAPLEEEPFLERRANS